MPTPKVFQRTGVMRPGRSVFNLSYEKKLTCDMGQLVPVMCDEVVPGDYFKIANQAVVRFQPMVAPILHEVNIYTHYFFVPYRLLFNELTDPNNDPLTNWEKFITGGEDGEDETVLPRWEVTDNTEGSLWDYLGFPTGVDPDGAYPLAFPLRAYNFIYNHYYRDENLVDEIDLDEEPTNGLLNRAWEKDYFTSSLPWQQKGTAPALPISGVFDVESNDNNVRFIGQTTGYVGRLVADASASNNMKLVTESGTPSGVENIKFGADTGLEVDMSNAITFDVSDLRLAFQIQKWMERNARSGSRYTEFFIFTFFCCA